MREEVVEPETRDLKNFSERRGSLLVGCIHETPRKGGENGVLFIQAGTDNEWESETRFVFAIEAIEERHLLRREIRQARGCLLLAGFSSKHDPADQIRMRTNEFQL